MARTPRRGEWHAIARPHNAFQSHRAAHCRRRYVGDVNGFLERGAQRGDGRARCARLGPAGVRDGGPRRRAVVAGSYVPSSRDANAACSRSGAPYIALRMLDGQWNRLELLCPNLSKHCAQSRLFWAADVPV
jgi:hypothetical protein